MHNLHILNTVNVREGNMYKSEFNIIIKQKYKN